VERFLTARRFSFGASVLENRALAGGKPRQDPERFRPKVASFAYISLPKEERNSSFDSVFAKRSIKIAVRSSGFNI